MHYPPLGDINSLLQKSLFLRDPKVSKRPLWRNKMLYFKKQQQQQQQQKVVKIGTKHSNLAHISGNQPIIFEELVVNS